jgi:putative tryptophan/tyrosine transport system substrate-binding protein
MRRRAFITLLGGAATVWPLASRAQQPLPARKIGLLQGLTANDPDWQRRLAAFRQGLADLGWVEGRNLVFEFRYADAKPERLPALAVELVEAKVDIIVTNAAQPVEAARKATSTIPIVMAAVGDALGGGYVASLARPGGNITGFTLVATEQSAKRLDLIKEMLPGLIRAAVLWNPDAAGHRLQWTEMQSAAPKLEIVLQSTPAKSADDIAAALRAAEQGAAQAIVTMEDPMIQSRRAAIAEFSVQRKIPVMGEFRSMADAGALMAYGPNQVDLWRRTATYIDKIFKGAKAADLPVEQPTKFELTINLKTAKALGLIVPPTLVARAEEVIE